MTHLDPGLLSSAALDAKPLGGEDADHLAGCDECRVALAEMQVMARDLAVMRTYEPAPAALARYYEAFAHVQPQPTGLAAMWRTFKAMLVWDSRQEPALQGVRSGISGASFRLLYATDQAEVEMLVEPEGRFFRTQGEIIPQDDEETPARVLTPALIQWIDSEGRVRYETESDVRGLFSQRNIAPGTYRLSIVSAVSPMIEIEALEIM
jgi:hypothetical protein